MKTNLYATILASGFIGSCGGSPPAATTPATTSAEADSHAKHHSIASADAGSVEEVPTAAPAATAAPVASVVPASESTPVASATSASVTKGQLTVTLTSTPATAAKQAVAYLQDIAADHDVGGSLDNRQMAFIPHVLVVTAGAKVKFSNSDPFPHNAFSPDNEKWDMGVIPAQGAKLRKFEKPGFYTVLCNMHPNMKAYIAVVASNYFAKSDKNGSLTIKDVPAGKHELVVWAPGVQLVHKDVVVEGDTSLSVELHR